MKRSEKGVALPLALMVLLLMSVLGVTLYSAGMTEVAIGTNWRAYSAAFYAAEAGVESGVVALRNLLRTPNPCNNSLQAISGTNNAPTFLTTNNITFTTFSITRVLPPPLPCPENGPLPYRMTFPSGPYTGLSGIVTDYQVAAQVQGEGGTKASLTQTVKYVQIPLFQFGVFYGQGVDLEIAPGAAMTFNGRVHANSNLYMMTNSSLDFDSYITTAGNVYRKLKRDSPPVRGNNNPRIKDANGNYQSLNFDHEYQPGFTSPWASEQDWKAKAESVFGSTLKDSTMGVGQITPPIPDLFNNPVNPDGVAHQMIEKGTGSDSAEMQEAKLYYQADLRIVDGVATNKNGNPVSLPAGVVTSPTFYDKREQANMNVTQVNIGALMASGMAPANGILYVSNGGVSKGVRVVNGAQLPSGGLTVASENPVYIQGNYNTTNKQPAAVLADAITVLSNNWGSNNSDSKGDQVTSNRPATDTTVNAAFALGPSAESAVNQGNGQLENVIRFLENWSGDTFTYRGSIISLWHSLRATGAWRNTGESGLSYYQAPNRNWGYDTLFNTTPPLGTPMGVIMMRGQWTQ